MVEETLAGHMDPERMPSYIGIVLNGLANITIEAIATSPKDYEHFRQAGFDLYWKGTGCLIFFMSHIEHVLTQPKVRHCGTRAASLKPTSPINRASVSSSPEPIQASDL